METILTLRKKYLSGEEKPSVYINKLLEEIKTKDKDIGAFLEVFSDAIKVAETADQVIAEQGSQSPILTGIPVAIKNNILIKGKKTTAASKILENYVATYDATVIARLKAEGAVLIGATNMDEFAMGSSTENSAFKITKNPIDPSRVPGGSSGGSASAVAMGVVPVALGTDTGGSIRQPASYCGLVGYKPTYGAVSRYGLIAMGSSLDQAGPLSQTVADAKIVHKIISGLDSYDGTTIAPDTYPKREEKTKYVFGVPPKFLSSGIDPDVMQSFNEHVALLKTEGHEVVDIDLPLFEAGLAAYYIVMPAEVSSNLAKFDGIRYGLSMPGRDLLDVYRNTRAEGFGPEVKRRILLGTYVLSSGYYDAYYKRAERVREEMRQELNQAFAKVDFIITPTTPTPAFKIGEQTDPLAMYRQDIFTVPVNLTGVPAISFPMGRVLRDGQKLPIGVQYIGPHGSDDLLLTVSGQIYDQKILGLS